MFKFLSHLAAFALIPPVLSIAQDVAEAPPGVDMYAVLTIPGYPSTDYETDLITSCSTNISITGSGCPAGSAGAGFSCAFIPILLQP